MVPYRKEHVAQYHEWMKDPAMLEATGSEPLSLAEEYEMQASWRDDADKCTFIVLCRENISDLDHGSVDQYPDNEHFVSETLSAMVGDVNLFLSEEEDSDDEEVDTQEPVETESQVEKTKYRQAELDIMIAEKGFQRKGIGREACCMMMLYAAKRLSTRRFFCKINEDNESSLALFRKLGFHQCDYAACFKQYELELKRDTPDEMVVTLEKIMGRDTLPSFRCPIFDETNE